MNLNHTLISFGRRIATAAVLACVLVSPSHALVPGDFIPIASGPVTGHFDNTIPFSLSVTSGIDYSTARISIPPQFNITSFVATLFMGLTPIATGADTAPPPGFIITNSFAVGSLAPGSYSLNIVGDAIGTPPGSDSYSGLLRVTAPLAPVPEPEIWAMMMVGAGLIGLRLRKKSRLDSARRLV